MDEKTKKNRPGETGFTICLLALCLFLLSGSVQLFRDDPQLSAAGGLPLILSVLLVIIGAVILVQNILERKAAEPGEREGLLSILKNIFPRDILVFIALLILYCVGLLLHLGFYPCTLVFLLAAMGYMDRKGWKWNLLTTVILLGAIYVAFTMIFKVQLP